LLETMTMVRLVSSTAVPGSSCHTTGGQTKTQEHPTDMREYNLVSADSHLEAPPEWADRVPEKYRDFAPRIVKLDNGGDAWDLRDGKEPKPLGLQVVAGQNYRDFVQSGRRFDEDIPGTRSAEGRILEMDRDGVDAEVIFCTVVATALKKTEDPNATVALVQAYNDWLSEYCSHAEDRLLGIGLIPMTGVKDAVAEIERIAAMPGIRGAHMLTFPSGGEFLLDEDDPFWEAAQATDMALVAHHNFGGQTTTASHPLPGLKERALDIDGGRDLGFFAWLLTCDLPIPTLPIVTVLQLIISGTLDRHPNLRFHFAETGIGWLPYWLEQMEDRYDRHRFWAEVDLERRPLEYVRDHFTFSFQEDHAGVALRHSIGVDNICWASDFPHSVSDWPWSREVVARMMKDVPTDERRRIQALNILTQLRVITPEQREDMAMEGLTSEDPETVPARGERRLA
jgi:predicted TIM-barrel fold metal-dependent hydrolase